MDIAITREVSPAIARCELTHLDRVPIDPGRAVAQHDDYCRRLAASGLEVVRLPADPECPDCCFVEDVAVVVDEVAVITMPGAASRRAETPPVAGALERHRPLVRMQLPATLDGGDVLQLGRRLFVGRTLRTNAEGIDALRQALAPFGYSVAPVEVTGCLHLKSAVTALDEGTVLANREWFDASALRSFEIADVDPSEPGAANVLRIREAVWAHPGYPRTLERLERLGHRIVPVDISEFIKAEAALTCKSLIFRR